MSHICCQCESPLQKILCCMMPSTSGQSHSTPTRHRVLSSLDHGTQPPNHLDYNFLKKILENQDMQSLLKVHDTVTEGGHEMTAVCSNASQLRIHLVEDLQMCCSGQDSLQLLSILDSKHFKALLEAHDKVACKDFVAKLPDIADEVDEDDGFCVKIVQLVKGASEPLGATVQSGNDTVTVARLIHGSAAHRSGLLEVGDEVRAVNGEDLSGQTLTDVLAKLSTTGSMLMTVRPGVKDKSSTHTSKVKVKACFDYNPYDDPYTPCPEASLSFHRGQILHIVSEEDRWWWQAHREGDTAATVGIIPSRLLAEKLKGDVGSKENKENRNKADEKFNNFSPRLWKKCKKFNEKEYVSHTQVYYEDMVMYRPRQHRPIVLVGATSLQLHQLIEMITKANPHTFAVPRLYSNEPERENSHEIVHVSAEELEKSVRDRKILEHEEKGGYFFAVTDQEIKRITDSGKTCIMTCKPETLHGLRRSDIKPYIILVKAVPQDKTKLPGIPKKISKISDCKAQEECSKIDSVYGHLIDTTVNYHRDADTLANTITDLANKIRTQPSWIPAEWTK